MMRDGLTFLSLTAVAIALGAVTTLLFRSFETHREDLAARWAERGRQDLQQGRSSEAVSALRTSLSYGADDRRNQLALAQALAASGHANEAETYYLNLWQAQPGDGLINLQLARLERARGEVQTAVNYYRAAVFGTWGGDALTRRRDIRLELSNYLIERGQLQAARAELLIAAGNNPDPETQLAIAQALQNADDPRDAMSAYRAVAAIGKGGQVGNAKGGELCYAAGDYSCAAEMLEKALRYDRWEAGQKARMTALQHDAERLQELAFTPEMAPAVRTSHLLNDARIAQSRLKACTVEQAPKAPAPWLSSAFRSARRPAPGAAASPPGPLQGLQLRWRGLDTARNRAALRRDDDLQEQYATLMNETETAVTQACGQPAGDDALLVRLQTHPPSHLVVTP